MECLKVDHKRREEIWKKRLTCRESWHFKQQLNKGKHLRENINWAEPARQRHNRRRKIITIVIIKAFFWKTIVVLRNVVRCWAILWGERGRKREIAVCVWMNKDDDDNDEGSMGRSWEGVRKVCRFSQKRVKDRAFSLYHLCVVSCDISHFLLIFLCHRSVAASAHSLLCWDDKTTENTKIHILCFVRVKTDRHGGGSSHRMKWEISLNKNLFISYYNNIKWVNRDEKL